MKRPMDAPLTIDPLWAPNLMDTLRFGSRLPEPAVLPARRLQAPSWDDTVPISRAELAALIKSDFDDTEPFARDGVDNHLDGSCGSGSGRIILRSPPAANRPLSSRALVILAIAVACASALAAFLGAHAVAMAHGHTTMLVTK